MQRLVNPSIPGIAVRWQQTEHVWIIAFSSVDDVGIETVHVDSTAVSLLLAAGTAAASVLDEFKNGLVVGSDQKGIIHEAAVHRTIQHRL